MPKRRRPKRSHYIPKSHEQIKLIARDLRRRLGIDDKYAPDLAHLLNRLKELYPNFKLKIVNDSDLPRMEAKAYSAAFMLKIREGIMKALRSYGDSRSRFTVGHELGHLMLSHPGNQPRERPGEKVSSENALLEHEANLFASEFLIPSNLFDPTLSTNEISRLFQVSTDAAARRRSETQTTEVKLLTFSDARHTAIVPVSTRSRVVFVSMPYAPDEMKRLYSEILKPAVQAAGFDCVRSDEISSAESIPTDIRRAIDASLVVVAEITGFNPNVMHEIGLAQSIDKPTIIICKQGYRDDEIPSNIRHIRRIVYSNDVGGGPELRRQLEKTLAAIAPT